MNVTAIYDSPLGTIAVRGLYAEIDNRWDKEFSSQAELQAWLKANKAEIVGYEPEN